MRAEKIKRPYRASLINHSMDARLGTRDAWKAIAPETDKMNAIEARHGHMSRQYARQLGVVNALRTEDYRRNFFRQMGVEI